MIIKNARNQEEGDWVFDLALTDDEVSYLVNLSIQSLLSKGVISLREQDEEQNISLPEITHNYSNAVN